MTTNAARRPSLRGLATALSSLVLVLAACQTTSPATSATAEPTTETSSTTSLSTSTGDESSSSSEGDPASAQRVIRGAHVLGHGIADIAISKGVITEIGPIEPTAREVTIAADGRWIVPAGIDSHVHLDYRREPQAMAAGGIAVAVDLAAPMAIFDERANGEFAPLDLLVAGPMLAAPGGYPTQGWGAAGFGLECADTEEAVAAVDELAERGASLIKISLENGPRLSDASITAVVKSAHGHGLKVLAHALGDADAAQAAAFDVDALAHTPLEPLSPATLAAFEGRAVVSTLRAFGSSDAAQSNLAGLREAGAKVLYGTDFGNSVVAGIDPGEVMAMTAAGMDPGAILDALTITPASFWGVPHGRIEVGAPASLLILSGDPLADPQLLATPEAVYINGTPYTDDDLGNGGIGG